MALYHTVVLLLISNWVLTTTAAYKWPNYVMDELEHLLVDGGGFNDGGVKSAVTPCSSGLAKFRRNAAEWVRVAFHDAATADVNAGTGGMDASIGFETLRSENAGPAMNSTTKFFSSFVNAHVSMSDLLALSVVMATGSCTSPVTHVPLRGGRIDATEAGPFGVPQPQTGISETLDQFKKNGFNQRDAIALTACGHSIGGLHSAILPPGTFPAGPPSFFTFDETPEVFDTVGMNDYLHWTGQLGGILVSLSNASLTSDFRLFNSDNNATIKEISSSSSHFLSTCVDVFTRMINTVPAKVTLTEEIVPNVVKPVNISLNVDTTGGVTFTGFVRLLSPHQGEDCVITIIWKPRVGYTILSTTAKFVGSGTGLFGPTSYYSFSAQIKPTHGISKFSISVQRGPTTTSYENGGDWYPIEDTVIWLAGDSHVSTSEVSISAAVLTTLLPRSVNAAFSIPTPQVGTMSPKIVTSTTPLIKSGIRGLYTVYTGTSELSLTNVAQTSVDIVVVTSLDVVVKDEFNKLGISL